MLINRQELTEALIIQSIITDYSTSSQVYNRSVLFIKTYKLSGGLFYNKSSLIKPSPEAL